MDRNFIIMGLLGLCFLLSGCSDDTTEPELFAVTVTVTDRQGDPVEGLRASLSPDVDDVIWSHGGKDGRPSTVIQFDLPEPSDYTMEILAVDGTHVWSISNETMPEGQHTVIWSAVDDQGDRVHDGYYVAELTTAPEDAPEDVVQTETPFLLIAGSPDVYTTAVTDAAGRFEVTDRTYVPAFWDLLSLNQVDEQGEIVATVEVTTATRLVLVDDEGNAMTHVFEAVDGPQALDLEWPH